MGAMAVEPADVALLEGDAYTRADLDALSAADPRPGRRYELIDGTILVSPSPRVRHQQVVAGLVELLRGPARAAGYQLLSGPVDVVLGASLVVPDLVAAPADWFGELDLPVPPVLAIEVRSPSTALVDSHVKRELYASHGIRWYWMVDPRPPIRIVVLELADNEYRAVAEAAGDDLLELPQPWPLRLVPSQLSR